ncbi:pseudaminic acid cytidylyltransferase [Vreelandella subterranea]|uniref:Pseudaminic acid cytidylyltransferase n=1 Tax=Vreelandella subterranea TaxID=416874 RepID=A0A1H9WLF5_9GAMM|nr:acylneuraminate cytidylyltransferase family protein [Halomonas subterranea]SES34720.1 pseudaminic acid cytidylyltransferase [Halomonas subterranea]
MKPVAIIPARGGSKRLPRKNILLLDGKSLLARVIDCCQNSELFGEVIVSTEDDEIVEIAKDAGAYVHVRSPSLAQDRSTVVEVCEDVLINSSYDFFCCVYATAAMLTPATLQKSFERFISNPDVNVVMGVSSYNYSPVQALKVDYNGKAEVLLPEYLGVQSQFQPKLRVSNGTFCWGRKESFLKEKTFYSNKLCVFDVPEDEVCDLDTPADYEMLLAKYKNKFS